MGVHIFPRLAWCGVMALVWLGLAGCAAPRVDWAARVGVYTYDQAVLEYGPPDKQQRLQDGTLVAEWLIRHGYAQTYVPYGYGSPYSYSSPYYYPAYVTSYVPNYYLRLIFGPNNRLVSWKKFAK